MPVTHLNEPPYFQSCYSNVTNNQKSNTIKIPRGSDKSLARQGRKQARKHVRDARDFNNIQTRAVIKFYFLQGKALKDIHAILTETLARFLPGRAKDLSAPYNRLNTLVSD
jgi:hypothetical protein